MLNKLVVNIKNGTLLYNGYKALKNRFIKFLKYNNLFISRDPFRVLTRTVLKQFPLVTENDCYKIGNYYIDKDSIINADSIVYSLGVGTQIDFDIELESRFGCKIHMFDPTPVSIEYMKGYTKPNFVFYPIGIWKEPTTFKFYKHKWGGSSSIIETENSVLDFEAECITIQQAMTQNSHSRIDLIKIDIEGAGLEVFKSMLEVGVFPKQVVIELERNLSDDVSKQISNLSSIMKLIEQVKDKYHIKRLPQTGVKYYALEFLFILK